MRETDTFMAGEIVFLQRVKAFNDNAICEVRNFIRDTNLSALSRKYEANLEKRDVDIGFNLFALISECYHQENFHSDILKALLDPKGKHEEQGKFLHLFLEFIRSYGVDIDLRNYSNAQVEREEGRVDLLIKDEVSKKAIIIENKINNAGDMHKQLPRYLKYVTANGYICDAIIYLRLNGQARPDMTDWTPNEMKEVNALLKVICAYEETENDLLTGWILKCERESKNPRAQHILRQYADLIKKLGGNIMNKPIMEKFYEIAIEGENLKTALSLKTMLDDLNSYRVERIIDEFKSDPTPFHKLFSYQNGALFQNLIVEKADFEMSVWVEDEIYWFTFLDRNDREGVKGQAKAMLQKMGCLLEFTCKDGVFSKKFVFPSQEEDLLMHIRTFKRKLGEAVQAIESASRSVR